MEEKRHIIESPNKDLSLKAGFSSILSDSSIFKKDKNFFFLCKKIDRLASAIYLLTDLFSDQEPMKWALRERSLKSISQVFSSKENLTKIGKIQEVELELLKIAGLVETAYLGGLISEMNAVILSKEIFNMVQLLSEYSNVKERNSLHLNHEFFVIDKGQTKGHEETKDIHLDEPSQIEATGYKRQNISQTDESYDRKGLSQVRKNHGIKTELKSSDFKRENKNDRQVEIIGIIKDKRNVSIKDISDIIKDCSEKTIQRELLAMVESGVLKKEGERRWSRYSLNL